MTCQNDANRKSDPRRITYLSLRLESIGKAVDVLLERTVVAEELDIRTVLLDSPSGLAFEVFFAAKGSEAPVLRNNDLLAARELVLRSAEGLKGKGTV